MLKFEFISMLISLCIVAYSVIIYRKKENIFHCITLVAFSVYILMIINICIFPIPFQKKLLVDLQANNEMEKWKVICVPFAYIINRINIYGINEVLKLIMLRVSLFIPISIYLQMLNTKYIQFRTTLKIIVLLALFIELAKVIIVLITRVYYKETCIDNVILYTIGGIFGYYCYRVVMYIYNKIIVVSKQSK